MYRKVLLESSIILLFLIILTGIIFFTGADITVSSWFCIGGKWPVGDLFPWHQLYQMDRFPAIILVGYGLLFAAYSFIKANLRSWRKFSIFLALFLIIGPGLIVNVGFKQNWGRPRPRDIVQFGGKKELLQPWQKGVSGGGGRSFPSGHSSAAFFMIAPFFIYRNRNDRLAKNWLLGGILFGIFMSIARLAQGGHFLSDNLWAFGIVYLVGLWLAAIMKIDNVKLSGELIE